MKNGKIVKYVTILIAAIAVISVFSAVFYAQIHPATNNVKPVDTSMKSERYDTNKLIKDLEKGPKITPTLDNVLKNTVNNKKKWVYVVVKNTDNGLKTPDGKHVLNSPIKVGLRLLSPKEIRALSKNPNVLKIFNHPKAQTEATSKMRNELINGKVGNVLNPLNFKSRGIYQTIHHGAQDAWMNGIMGSNVTISIVDTGVDFAQPNLYGAWAVDENPNSPYYGWPIVYDSWSMALYLEANVTGIDAYYKYGTPSWYVNTSYNTTELPNGTVYFNGYYYNVKGIHSASGYYHLGVLPETYNYLRYFHKLPAVLLVDSKENYTYDTVYVDLNLNHDFTDEKPTNKTSPVSYRDDYNATSKKTSKMWNGGDGYPDWSGGMIYFIADGNRTLPGSDMFSWWNSIPNRVPGNGDLVAFEGDFDDYPHGTACAANAVSRGVTIGGLGMGMAPRAKIIAEPHFWMDGITEWMFAQLGNDFWFYDGDDAQISSNSWGSSFVHWDGWDTMEDRIMEYVAVVFPIVNGAGSPQTSFLVALGNGGPGYGTATSPAVQDAISVGAGSEMGYRQILFGDSNKYDSYYGDVVDFSARGPFANGKATPDILATGEFGITPMALNYPDIYGHVGDGSMHFDLFSGTSMATPVAAGGLALIYDAYYKTYGMYPNIWTAKNILLSSADDHNYDPLSQGPGWMNISYAVNMILGKGGVSVSPNIWNVGTYNKISPPMFAGIAYPGETLSKELTIKNEAWNTTHSANVSLSTGIYKLSYERNVTLTYTKGDDKDPTTWRDISKWLNLSNMSIPSNTDLLQVIAYTNYTSLDSVNDTYHEHPNIYYNIAYLWDYLNSTARMRIQVSAGQGNTIDVMFHDPMKRIHGNMMYQLRVIRTKNVPIDFHVKIVGYRAVDWSWLSLSANNVKVNGNNGTATVTANLTVPNNAIPGIYEGKIFVYDGNHTTSVPVVVFVAAQINSLSDVVNIGGQALSEYNTYLYENSHVRGLYDWMWRAEAGDWRFFFLNVSSSVNIHNAYLTVDVSWQSSLTDIDAFLLENASDVLSENYPGIFGPYTEVPVAMSADMYIKNGMYAWQTSSGGAREVIAAPLQNGLVEIMLHNVLYSGINASERFSVKVYITTYSPQNPHITVGSVIGLSGHKKISFTMHATTSKLDTVVMPMLYVDAKNNIPISTGEDKYFTYMTTGWTYLMINARSIAPKTDDIDLYMFYSDDGRHYYYSGIRSATSSGDETVVIPNPGAHPYWLADVNGYNVAPGCTFNLTAYEGLPNLPVLGVTNLPTSITPGTVESFNITYNFTGYDIPAGTYVDTVYFGPAGSGGSYPVHITFTALQQNRSISAEPLYPPQNSVTNETQPVLAIQWNTSGGIYNLPKNATWWIDGIKIPSIRTGISNNAGARVSVLYAVPSFVLADGTHEVKVYFEDTDGNNNTTSWTFEVNTEKPTLTITSPSNGNEAITYSRVIWINGTTSAMNVSINGVTVPVAPDGSFSYQAALKEGLNVFTVKATNEYGNTATATVTALYMPELPQLWDNIHMLSGEIAALQANVSAMQNEITILQQNVQTLSSNVNLLQAQLLNLSNALNSLEKALEENVTALNNAMLNIENATMQMIEENITKINGEMNNLTQQANAIKKQIDDEVNAVKQKDSEQDGAIGTATAIGIVGIVLALIAMLMAAMNMTKKKKTSHNITSGHEENHESSEELAEEHTIESEEEDIPEDI